MSYIRRINSTLPIVFEDNMIQCIAGEDITAGTVIIKDVDDLAYTADIFNESHAHRTIGVALETAKMGDHFIVQISGNTYSTSWNFEFNKPIYIGDGGKPTQTKPTSGFVQMLGIPYTTNSVFIDIEPAIIFSFKVVNFNVTQSDIMNAPNQVFTFTCNNTGYDIIEWRVVGYSYTLHSSNLIGTIATSKILKISWSTVGNFGVKVRLKDSSANIFTQWSPLLIANVM